MWIEENTITTAMLEKVAEEMKQQRDEIERLREALLEASEYAGRLAASLHHKHYSELPQFELLPDLYGRLTQIDNMTCGMARAALGEGKE